MNIREPQQYAKVRAERQAKHRLKKFRKVLAAVAIVVVVAVLVAFGAYARPLPAAAAKTFVPVVTPTTVALAWPASGQAAIGVLGQGSMAQTDNQQPAPMASVAKVMLSLMVLKKQPLQPGQPGPTVPITAADEDLYNEYVSQGGSVVPVQVGQPLTEYQALQAVMLPSANNVADTLAIWAYGSMAAYHTAANQYAQSLGMTQTTFAGDASGLLPESVSTPHDLVLLGQAAQQEPVLKEIAAQESATIPVAGTIENVNFMLGRGGIVGIKTGNTDQAGGCYLFAATRTIEGQPITVVGAIMSASSLGAAMTASLRLLDSFYAGFGPVAAVPKGTVVARYAAAWGAQTEAVTTQDTAVVNWRGSKTTIKVDAQAIKPSTKAGTQVGSLTAQTPYAKAITKVTLVRPLEPPTAWWRIYRH